MKIDPCLISVLVFFGVILFIAVTAFSLNWIQSCKNRWFRSFVAFSPLLVLSCMALLLTALLTNAEWVDCGKGSVSQALNKTPLKAILGCSCGN